MLGQIVCNDLEHVGASAIAGLSELDGLLALEISSIQHNVKHRLSENFARLASVFKKYYL